VEEREVRTALNQHWAASASGDQNNGTRHLRRRRRLRPGERILGRRNLQALRSHHPDKPAGFEIRRLFGSGDLWITEYTIEYQGRPSYTVSIMEFKNGKVVHETQYFADPFDVIHLRGVPNGSSTANSDANDVRRGHHRKRSDWSVVAQRLAARGTKAAIIGVKSSAARVSTQAAYPQDHGRKRVCCPFFVAGRGDDPLLM
jgi:hypothetical protein